MSENKTVLITGGTGVIGQFITSKLLDEKFKVYVLTRDKNTGFDKVKKHVELISKLEEIKEKINIVINLAGVPLDSGRWDDSFKESLITSRVDMTKKLIKFLHDQLSPPELIISGSAIFYYGENTDVCDEKSKAVPNFCSELFGKWERGAMQSEDLWNARVCLLRTGFVLSKKYGILAKVLPFFNRGFGGIIGNGKQNFSWIHIDDLVNIVMLLINNQDIKGPVNCVSPNSVTNKEFTKTLGSVLKKPTLLIMPRFIFKPEFCEIKLKNFIKSIRDTTDFRFFFLMRVCD